MTPSVFFFLIMRNVAFSAELLLGEWMFVRAFDRRKYFLPCAAAGIAAMAGICFALVYLQNFFIRTASDQYFVRAVNGFLSYIILFIGSLCVIKFCYKCNLYKIMFCGIAGFCIKHFTFSLYLFALNLIDGNLIMFKYGRFNAVNFVIYLSFFVTVYTLIYVFLARKITKDRNLSIEKPIFALFIIVLLINIIAGTVGEIFNENSVPLYLVCLAGQMASTALIVAVQVFMLERLNMGREILVTQHLLQEQAKQYKFSKSHIDQVDIKIHDLKHQIKILRGGGEEAEKLLSELESLTGDYDGMIKTENEVVNCLIAEKWMYCRDHEILLSYKVEAQALNFMVYSDIYSLIGNILDNAIEAASKCGDVNKRVVNLTIFEKSGVVFILCNNYFEGALNWQNGLPVTSKNDEIYHGYGIKSIGFIAKKYGGAIDIKTDNDIFIVQVSIPHTR